MKLSQFYKPLLLNDLYDRTRDELCAKGEVLQSPALDYTLMDLEQSVAEMRAEKRGKEVPQEEDLAVLDIKSEESSLTPTAQVLRCCICA